MIQMMCFGCYLRSCWLSCTIACCTFFEPSLVRLRNKKMVEWVTVMYIMYNSHSLYKCAYQLIIDLLLLPMIYTTHENANNVRAIGH